MLTPAQLKPHQIELLQAKKKYAHIDGGVGTYKSTACVLRLYVHCLLYPGQRIMVLAQTYAQLIQVFMAEWKRQVPANDFKYVGSPVKKITLPSCDAEIRLQYADGKQAEEVVRGESLTGFYVIQGETLKDVDVFDQADLRVRLWGKGVHPGYIRLIDTNPGAPSHFIHQRFIDKSSEVYLGDDIVHYINVETTPETSVYDQQTIDQLERTLRPERFRQMIKGEWCSIDGTVYDDYETIAHPDPNDIDQLFIGIDPGTANDEKKNEGNLAVVFLGRLRETGKFVVLEAIPIRYAGVEELARVIDTACDYWGADKLEAVIKDWAGGSGAVFSTELPKYSRYVDMLLPPGPPRAQFKSVSYGITTLYEALKIRKLVISANAVKIIRDMHNYVYDHNGEPDKKAYDSHLLDALRYAWIRMSIVYMIDK